MVNTHSVAPHFTLQKAISVCLSVRPLTDCHELIHNNFGDTINISICPNTYRQNDIPINLGCTGVDGQSCSMLTHWIEIDIMVNISIRVNIITVSSYVSMLMLISKHRCVQPQHYRLTCFCPLRSIAKTRTFLNSEWCWNADTSFYNKPLSLLQLSLHWSPCMAF